MGHRHPALRRKDQAGADGTIAAFHGGFDFFFQVCGGFTCPRQETTSSNACLDQLGVQILKPSEQQPLQLFTAAQNMPLQYGAEAPIPKSWTYL